MKNFTARHLPVVAAPIVPSWHAFGASAVVAGVAVAARATAAAGTDVATTSLAVLTSADDKRTTSHLVDFANSSPPV